MTVITIFFVFYHVLNNIDFLMKEKLLGNKSFLSGSFCRIHRYVAALFVHISADGGGGGGEV
jgi:hypothetical protein